MTKKIKLLIGVNNFTAAGAQKLVADHLNHFDMAKYELALLTFFQEDERDNFFHLLKPGIKNYRLNFRNAYDVKNWFRVRKVLREFQPDIVLSHLFFSNTVLRVLKPFFRYKIVIYEHNIYKNKTWLQRLADKILSYFTHKIIADSQTIKDFTVSQEKINPRKFVVLPCSINYYEIRDEVAQYNKDELKQSLGFQKDDKLIINAARLVWQKNHKLLIDSFAEFSKKNSQYKLIILGEGPFYEVLKKQIEDLNLTGKVLLLGFKRNVLQYMLISEFFVLTSKIEGFPVVALEAMAVGLPLISTKVAGLDKAIIDGFNGYLVPNEDQKEFAQALQKVADQGRDYFSENCRKTAEHYDIKQYLEKLEEIMRP